MTTQKKEFNKEFELVISGRCPSKKNSRINTRSGRSFPNKKYKEWHEHASWQLYTQKKKMGIAECDIEIRFFPPDKRRWDLTNKAESIMDLLVDNGILIDDNAMVVQKLTLIAMPQTLTFEGAKIKITTYEKDQFSDIDQILIHKRNRNVHC